MKSKKASTVEEQIKNQVDRKSGNRLSDIIGKWPDDGKFEDLVKMERQIMICECHSIEHQIIFWYDPEDDELYCEPHLTTHRNFFKRLWRGLKYAFGYKSRYGDWDSTIFKKKDLEKLRTYLDKQTHDG